MQEILVYISRNRIPVILGYLTLAGAWIVGTDYLLLPGSFSTAEFWLAAKDWLFFGVFGSVVLVIIAGIGTTVVRKNIEDDLKQSLEEKQVLLSEIHHRVKNNLAIVSGLLELQLEDVEDERIRYALRDSQRRIHSMAMIHEKLYTSRHFSNIGVAGYLEDLLASIQRTYGEQMAHIRMESNIDDVHLDIDQAIPLGLIVNELVSNVFKHAFRERNEGRITVELQKSGEGIRLRVADDGIGLPGELDLGTLNPLGMRLVDTLATQLNGSLDFRNLEQGCEFTVLFSK